MHTGVVRAWSKGYGFAEAQDGRTVFIHHKEIGHGNRLRVGGQLQFDIEENDGHDGRVKARNVSGSGIVTWAEWKKTAPSQDEREGERAMWDLYKREHLGYESGTGHPKNEAQPTKKRKKRSRGGAGKRAAEATSSVGNSEDWAPTETDTAAGTPSCHIDGEVPAYPLPMMPGLPLAGGYDHIRAGPFGLMANPFCPFFVPQPCPYMQPPCPQPTVSSPPAAAAEAPPSACTGCGGDLVAGARFCHLCGSSTAPPCCSRCGGLFAKADAAFCHRCGTPSGRAQQQQQQQQQQGSQQVPQPTVASPWEPPAGESRSSPPLPPQQQGCSRDNTPDPPVTPEAAAADRWAHPPAPAGRSPPQQAAAGEACSPHTSPAPGERPSSEEAPCVAPWLEHAGLAGDGSAPLSSEISAFAAIQTATASERAKRAAVRTSLQKVVNLAVCPDATVKLIGGWATGLAAFDSPLDLVLEVPSSFRDPLISLRAALSDLCVEATLDPRAAGGMPRVHFDAAALAAALSDRASQPPPEDSYTVSVYAGVPGSAARAATTAARAEITRAPHLRDCIIAVRAALRHLSDDAGLGGHAVTLMALALFERCRRDGSAAYDDPGEMFCTFFRFYSTFDFCGYAVCPFARGSGPRGSQPTGELFPPKRQPGPYVCILDATADAPVCETAEGARVCATLDYLSQVIHSYEHARRYGSVTGALLANIIPMRQLGARHEWLRRRDGLEATRELAVAVAKGVAAFVEDPVNKETMNEFLEMAAWDTMQGMVRDARLLKQVVERPSSELAALREYVPDLQRCLDTYASDPAVQKAQQDAVAMTVSRDQVAALLDEAAAFLEHDLPDQDIDSIRHQLMLMTQACDSTNIQQVAENLFSKIAALPGSSLAQYQATIPALLQGAHHAFQNDPELAAKLRRVFHAAVGQGYTKEVAKEVIAWLKDADNAETVAACLKGAINSTGWQGAVPVLTVVAERPGSLLSPFKDHIPLLVEALQAKYYDDVVSGSGDAELCQLVSMAATSAVTKDVALMIAQTVCDFLEDPANEEVRKDLIRTAQSDTTENLVKTHTRLFQTMADIPGSRLCMYRHNIEELVNVMDSFHGDPDIDAARRRASRAIIDKDVADRLLRDVVEIFDHGLSDTFEDAARLVSAGGEGWRATVRAVWENLEARVCQEVLSKLCEESPLWKGRLKQAGGLSSVAEIVRQRMGGIHVWNDEPELRALRRRAAQAAVEGSIPGPVPSVTSGGPPELDSDPCSSQGEAAFYTPPDSPASSAHSHEDCPPPDAGAELQGAKLHRTAQWPGVRVVDGDPGELIPLPPSVRPGFFSPLAAVRARPADLCRRISAPIETVHAAVLSDDPKGALCTLHRQRGDAGLALSPWQHPPDGHWAGARLVTHEAHTPLGPRGCNEGERYWVSRGSAPDAPAVLTLHWTSQVTGVPLGALFRTETLYEFEQSGAGETAVTVRSYIDSSALGLMAGVVSDLALAAAADAGVAFVGHVASRAERAAARGAH